MPNTSPTPAAAAAEGVTIPLYTDTGDGYQSLATAGLQKNIYAHVTVLGIAGTDGQPVPTALSTVQPAMSSTLDPSARDGTGIGTPKATGLFVVDTGSWATVLPYEMVEAVVGQIDFSKYPQYEAGSLEYSSDGTAETGYWVPLTLAFPDAQLPDGSVPTTTVTALVTTGSHHPHMLGVGFNTGYATKVTGTTLTSANNAVLNLQEMKDGNMARSYMIDTDGLHLGWSVETQGANWTTQTLTPAAGASPAGSPPDWTFPVGTVTIDGVVHDGMNMLFDTGTPDAFIHYPGVVKQPTVPDGKGVTVTVAGTNGAAVSYGFATGDDGPETPPNVSQSPAQHGPDSFMNTGANFFRDFKYVYDADRGLVGFEAYDTGTPSLFGTVVHDTSTDAGKVVALYEGLLDRAPDLLGAEHWTSLLEDGASLSDVTQAILTSAEGRTHVDAADNVGFVEDLYETVLQRQGDAAGVAHWISALDQGVSRATVAEGFVFSQEHLRTLQPTLQAGVFVADDEAAGVARLYYGLLDRAPDAAGLQHYVHHMNAGGSLAEIAQGMLNSQEYAALHQTRLMDEAFVAELYEDALGRQPEAAGQQAWVDALAQGTSRAQVAIGIAQSTEAQLHLVGRIEEAGVLLAVPDPHGPTMAQEVSFINGLNPDGSLTDLSYWGGHGKTAHKWVTSPTEKGAVVTYAFDASSGFTDAEQATALRAFDMWASVADVQFVAARSQDAANILIHRGDDGHADTSDPSVNGSGRTPGYFDGQVKVSIDTSKYGFDLSGSLEKAHGYGFSTIVHELGHALGLGHAGAYNGHVDPAVQQYSAYDERMWTVMSYINWTQANEATFGSVYPEKGTYWGKDDSGYRNDSHTVMQLDILAIQQLYGKASDANTSFSGSNTFGFNNNISGDLAKIYDFTINKQPVVTLYSQGSNNTLDLSGFVQDADIDLRSGAFSSAGGLKNNIAIAQGTVIEAGIGGAGNDTIVGNTSANTLDGKAGADTMAGLTGNDTYHVDNAGDRVFEVAGEGADRVYASVDYVLAPGQSIEALFAEHEGATHGLTLSGNDLSQHVRGTAGEDVIDGRAGADTLTGLGGGDTFVFSTALGPNNVDRISDFEASSSGGHDLIQLSHTIFSALAPGTLQGSAFKDLAVAGSTLDADDRILYDRQTGALSYDADGSGTSSSATLFATLDNKAHLHHYDFVVV